MLTLTGKQRAAIRRHWHKRATLELQDHSSPDHPDAVLAFAYQPDSDPTARVFDADGTIIDSWEIEE